MTLTELDRLARDLQALLATASERVEDFATGVSAARAQSDPFASLYFAARKSYRHACQTANKGGAKIERDLISSYKKAVDLGFKGSIRDWQALLRICLPYGESRGPPWGVACQPSSSGVGGFSVPSAPILSRASR
jgi:hypothetical protein